MSILKSTDGQRYCVDAADGDLRASSHSNPQHIAEELYPRDLSLGSASKQVINLC